MDDNKYKKLGHLLIKCFFIKNKIIQNVLIFNQKTKFNVIIK